MPGLVPGIHVLGQLMGRLSPPAADGGREREPQNKKAGRWPGRAVNPIEEV